MEARHEAESRETAKNRSKQIEDRLFASCRQPRVFVAHGEQLVYESRWSQKVVWHHHCRHLHTRARAPKCTFGKHL